MAATAMIAIVPWLAEVSPDVVCLTALKIGRDAAPADEGDHTRRTCFAMMFRWTSSEPPAMLAARPSK